MNHYDAIVIGGGIVGAATADALTQAGQDTLLVDQFAAGHKRGSSHGDGRIVRFNYSEAIYVEMATHAYPAWERLSKRVGKPFLQQTGLVEYDNAGSVPIAKSKASMDKFGIAYETITPDEANARFPQCHFAPDTEIIYQADGAVAFATPAVLALWQLVRDGGSTTLDNTRIEQIDIHENSVTLTSDDGTTFTADKLVITAGGWIGKIASTLGLTIPVDITREVLAYFKVTNPQIDHRAGTMPVAIDYTENMESPFYSLPQIDIAGVKAGWHHTGDETNPDATEDPNQRILAGSKRWVERFFPHLENTPFEVQTCLYTNTPDYHFVLDRHPQYSHVTIGAGFSGHGFKFGVLLGEMLCNLALGKPNPVAMDTFALSRFDNMDDLQKRVGA